MDVASAAAGLALLWEHRPVLGVAVVVVPPIALALWLALRSGDPPDGAADTPPWQVLRLVGLVVAAVAAWQGSAWALALGAIVYLVGFAPVRR